MLLLAIRSQKKVRSFKNVCISYCAHSQEVSANTLTAHQRFNLSDWISLFKNRRIFFRVGLETCSMLIVVHLIVDTF